MFGHKAGPSKVYEFGCGSPTEGAEYVDVQILLAHRYRNRLVEIELERRRKVREATAAHSGEVAALEAKTGDLATTLEAIRGQINEARKTVRGNADTAALEAEAKRVRAELRTTREALKEAKAQARRDPVLKQRLHEIAAEAQAAIRQARGESALYWGTYLTVEQGMDRARTGKMDPRFRRFDGSGKIAVQLQGGLPVGNLFGADTRIQIDPVPEEAWTHPSRGERRRLCRTRVRIRVGSAGADNRTPIWAEFPVMLHRPLPPDGLVKWAYVVRERVGTKFKYKLQIVVETHSSSVRVRQGLLCGLDIGWRQVDGGLRVAYWADEAGEHGQLVLPNDLLAAFARVDDLRSIRDKNFNAARNELVKWVSKPGCDLPDWLREETATLHHWRAPGRLAALTRRWRERRFDGDGSMYVALEAWRKQDKHLLEWEANQRGKAIRRRREIYRGFAASLRDKYSAVVIEDFDLRQVAKTPKAEDGFTSVVLEPDHLRTIAALSTLRQAVQHSGVMVLKAPAAFTTRRCHKCGHTDNFDTARWVMHRCSKCGELWDQDYNAAINLLQAGIAAAQGESKAEGEDAASG